MSETAVLNPDTADVPPDDIEVILPIPGEVTINGLACTVRRLKTREFLALLRVVTSGLGPALGEVDIDFTDGESFGRDMSALMLLAIPNAVDEFALFLTQIVEPKDKGRAGEVSAYLADNPDLDVLLDVFEKVAEQEKDDLAVLAGKTQAIWKRLGNLYRPKSKTG